MTVGPDGEVVYPWQQVSKKKRQEELDFEIVEIIPLRALVKSISQTGNLTIEFNKPVILPPIRVDNLTVEVNVTEASRALESKNQYQYSIE